MPLGQLPLPQLQTDLAFSVLTYVDCLLMVITIETHARARCVWSESELARQTCSERLDRGERWTDGGCQTEPHVSAACCQM